MAPLLYLIALASAFAAGSLAVYALMPSQSQMYELRTRTAGKAEADMITSPLLKLLWPLLAALVPYTGRIGSAAYREARAKELPLAGLPPVMRVEHFLALKMVLAVLAPLMAAWVLPAFRHPVAFVAVGAIGFWLPDRMLTEQRQAREQKVLRALPSAVDVLTLGIEAGMDFLSALQRVVEKGAAGPLREEITTIVNDIRLGATRSAAMKSFATRINIPEIVSFVGVLVQADRLGASVGEVLRAQADRMRTERFQRAEKEGAKASQKLLLPLAVFIFPAVLLVIVAPVVLSFLAKGSPF